jgi:hypothetical protein
VINRPKDDIIPNAHGVRQQVECGIRRANFLKPPVPSWIKLHSSYYSDWHRLVFSWSCGVGIDQTIRIEHSI